MIWEKIFRLKKKEVSFEVRGFLETDTKKQKRLEKIGEAFVSGFNSSLGWNLDKKHYEAYVESEYHGFDFEGAAMGFALQDQLSIFYKKRLSSFLGREAKKHKYMVHIGIGWAYAKLPHFLWSLERALSSYEPSLKWLLADGYGFCKAFFDPTKYIEKQKKEKFMYSYTQRAFDQGIGRCLLFYTGANVNKIAELVLNFETSRQADIWSGVGLAVTYAGGVSEEEIKFLLNKAVDSKEQMAQGAVFAAKARSLAGIVVEHNELALQTICNMDTNSATKMCDEIHSSIDPKHPDFYEEWRCQIQKNFKFETVAEGV